MAQTSIHICPVKGGSELHNERRKMLDYVRPEFTPQNQAWKSPDFPAIDEQHARIKADYQTAHGKKMHANATPIREAVVVIQEDTTMQQLLSACAKCREKFGIEAMQIYTHRDEGHTAEDGSWKPNLHAHIIFNWYSSNTHTTHKLSRQDMAEMQTLFAESLGMERGVSSDRKHLTAIQQKNEAEAAKLQRLQEQVQQQTAQYKAEAAKLQHLQEQVQQQTAQYKADLQQECKNLRRSGISTVRAFDYLCGFDAVKPSEKQRAFRDNLDQECHRDLPTETNALADYSQALRFYLINTINAVRDIGKRLQQLASHIPLLKRHKLAHEAKLESAVAAADKRAETASKSANAAISKAKAEQDAAAKARMAAEHREMEAKQKLQTLQEEIEQARKSGYNAGATDKHNEWTIWYNQSGSPAIKERDRLKIQVAQLEKDLAQAIQDHTQQAVETAKELQRNWGTAPFEGKSLNYNFTEFGSWDIAKKELQQERAQQNTTTGVTFRH